MPSTAASSSKSPSLSPAQQLAVPSAAALPSTSPSMRPHYSQVQSQASSSSSVSVQLDTSQTQQSIPSTSNATDKQRRAPSPSMSEGIGQSTSSLQSQSLQMQPGDANSRGLSDYLSNQFLPSVLPTHMEFAEKESMRKRLEMLATTVLPGAKLLPFGSTANDQLLEQRVFTFDTIDMDLCCMFDRPPVGRDGTQRTAPELVEMLAAVISRETNIHVKALPRARIPIIKLTLPPTPGAPFGLACDIGFNNRLALENTRLLFTYATVDHRLRTMVLFVKVWTKRRKINNTYVGTLSSYGYVLMVIFYLTHVAQPPVLPNLQRIPPFHNVSLEEMEYEGHDIWFFDDTDILPHLWSSSNTDNVGELLIGFFQYFAKEFPFATDVISIRSERGLLSKEAKGWNTDREAEVELFGGPRDLNRICIEDPFQTEYNVSRTVTRDGLFTIVQEFQRANKLLCGRASRISSIITELCEERDEALLQCPPGASAAGGRRRSAPSSASPAPVPAAAQVLNNFRAWAATNIPPPAPVASTSTNPYASRVPYNYQQQQSSSYYQNSNTSTFAERADYSQTSPPQQSSTSLPNRYYNSNNAQRSYRYNSNPSTRHNQNHYNNQYNRRNNNLAASTSPNSLASPYPSLERRSSWDGSTASPRTADSNRRAPSEYGGSKGPSAPTSPLLGASLPFANGRVNPSTYANGPRSQSQTAADRQRYYAVPAPSSISQPASPRQSRANSISFGDFSSNVMGSVMDTALARAEDRRRKGMVNVDAEHEAIAFGDIRVFRRAGSNTFGMPDIDRAKETFLRNSPHTRSSLPSVVEAVQPARPNTPSLPAAREVRSSSQANGMQDVTAQVATLNMGQTGAT